MPAERLVELAAFKLDVAIGKNREIEGRERKREKLTAIIIGRGRVDG